MGSAAQHDASGGFDAARCAEVIAGGRRGSGYLIADGLVLTALHVVAGTGEIRARFDAGRPDEWTATATLAWHDADHDVALLRLDGPARPVVPARFGALPDARAAVIDVHAAGFPRWKLRRSADRVFRDLHDAHGSSAVASNRRSGTLELTVEPPGDDPDPAASPWEAMSGAAVWSGDRIIGIVAEHHRREGLNRLTARRVDRCLAGLPPGLLGADLVDLADVVPVPAAQRMRSSYTAQVRDIAPTRGLVGRDAELGELAEFCAGAESYVWWQAAPWAGKSALMSTFVLSPPDGVDVVSFFVTGRLASQSDSEAFTDALLDQLQALLGEVPLPSLSLGARDAYRRDLLRRAARRSRQDGRRLVLVVDGLDEDTGTAAASRLASIASLLPKDPADGLRVVLAGRPHPPIPDDVPADHPLRTCRVRPLPQSEHAQAIQHDATRELQRLLSGDQTSVEILGFLAAGGGGLSRADLADLTGQPPFVLDSAIHSAFGRTITRRCQSGAVPVYLYAHDTLRATAEQQLGSALLAAFRARILTWADGYQEKGWPSSTPAYLLDDYPRMLFAAGLAARLAACAVDPDRHDRLLEATGGDAAALAVIRAAHDLAVDQDSPDLLAIVHLTTCRERLAARNTNIPTDLPAVWASLGHADRAESLARSITDPRRQALALTGVVEAIADTGHHERAAEIAAGIADPAQRTWALVNLAETVARADRLALSAEIAAEIPDAARKAWTLVHLAEIAQAAGDRRQAVRMARAVCDGALVGALAGAPDGAIVAAVRAVATVDLDTAAAIARAAAGPAGAAAMVAVVEAAVATADRRRAAALARSITDPAARSLAVLSVTHACLVDGDYVPAVALNQEAPAASTLWSRAAMPAPAPQRVSTVAADPVHALTRASPEDGPTREEVLTLQVRRLSEPGAVPAASAEPTHVPGPGDRVAASVALATALVLDGAPDRAVEILDALVDPVRCAWASTSTARAVAAWGHVEVATTLADRIADPGRRALALGLVTSDLVEAGMYARATAVAGLAAGSVTAIAEGRRRWAVLCALTRQASMTGDLEMALSLVQQIGDRQLRNQCLVDVAGQGGDAQFAAIASLVNAIEDPADRATGLIGLIAAADGEWHRELIVATIKAAQDITDARRCDPILAALATQVAGTGVVDPLLIVRAITDHQIRAGMLVELREFLAAQPRLEVLTEIAVQRLPASERSQVLIALVDHALDHGDQDAAAAFVREIPDADTKTLTALRLIDLLNGADRPDLAVAVARDIDDPGQQAFALGHLARVAVTTDDLDRAAAAGAVITDESEQAAVLVPLVESILTVGRPDAAIAVAHTIARPSTQVSVLANLACAVAATGDHRQAAAIAQQITDPTTQAAALTALAGPHVEAGDFGGAAALTGQIREPGYRAEALTALAAAAAAAGSRETALELAVSAAAAAHGVANSVWRQDALHVTLHASLEAGERARALTLCRALTDTDSRSEGMTLLAVDGVVAGDLLEAAALVTQIPGAHRRVWAASVLAQAAVDAGATALAEATVSAVGDSAARAVGQVLLAEHAVRVGQVDVARRCLAAASVSDIDDVDVRLLALVAWARTAIAAGDVEAGAAVATELIACADLSRFTSGPIAVIDRQIGSVGRGAVVAELMPGVHRAGATAEDLPEVPGWDRFAGRPRLWAVGALAAALAEAGAVDLCVEAIRAVDDEEERAELLAEAAEELANAGRIAEACAVAVATDAVRAYARLAPVLLAAIRLGETDAVAAELRRSRGDAGYVLRQVADAADPSTVDGLVALADAVDSENGDWIRASAARALARSGHYDHALRIVDAARDARRRRDDETLISLALCAAKSGRLDLATAHIHEVDGLLSRRTGFTPADLPELVSVLARSALHAEAVALVRRVMPSGFCGELFATTVTAVAGAGAVGDALDLAEELLDGERMVQAIVVIAGATTDARHRRHAARLVERVIADAVVIPDAEAQARLLEHGVRAWLALDRLDDAATLAPTIRDAVRRDAALAWIVSALTAADRIEDAVRVAGLTDSAELHARLIVEVVTALVLAGRRQEAHAVMGDVTDPFAHVDDLVRTARTLITEGRHDQARALAELAAPLIRQATDDGRRGWSARIVAEIVRDPASFATDDQVLAPATTGDDAGAVEDPLRRARARAASVTSAGEPLPAATARRIVAELLMGPQWVAALRALEQVDPDVFRHVPELLLRDR